MNTTLDVSVVIPTYCEKENLSRVLPTLFAVLDQAGQQAEVIVVDDDSRDGTATLCKQLGVVHRLRLITRQNERGLATAVLRGLSEARGAVCVVMDADGSHPPEAVPSLIAAICSPECDLALGSRYAAGGTVDPNWGWFRRLNSRVASLLARGLTDAADPMAGFFAIRSDTLSRAATLRPIGYKIALELIVRCHCRNIVEVPIVFQNRTIGQSKLSLLQQWLYLRHLGRLYVALCSSMLDRRKPLEPNADALIPTKRRAA